MKSLTKDQPLKVILLFAVPLYVGQLFQLCYGLIDTRIIGSVLGETSLAAVGATSSLSDLLIEFLNGIICGFGVIISEPIVWALMIVPLLVGMKRAGKTGIWQA